MKKNKIASIVLGIIGTFLLFGGPGTTPPLWGQQESLIAIAQEFMPSIVHVTAVRTKTFKDSKISAGRDKASGRIFFLRNLKTAREQRRGAGVIIDASGIIVTNTHTIAYADQVFVTLADKTTLPAQIVKVVPEFDFAFLRVASPGRLHPVTFSDSDNIHLGEDIVTVGNSALLNNTITGGKIIGMGTSSSKNPQRQGNPDLLQTTVNVYKGDSGGPLFDKKGRFIGLMVAGQIKKDHSSFAVSSNMIKKHYEQYLSELTSPE